MKSETSIPEGHPWCKVFIRFAFVSPTRCTCWVFRRSVLYFSLLTNVLLLVVLGARLVLCFVPDVPSDFPPHLTIQGSNSSHTRILLPCTGWSFVFFISSRFGPTSNHLSDVRARFCYLMRLLEQSHKDVEPGTPANQSETPVHTDDSSVSIPELLATIRTLLGNPRCSVDLHTWDQKLDHIDLFELEREFTSMLNSSDHSTLESTLCILFSAVVPGTEGVTVYASQTFQFVCEVIFKFHVSRTKKPLSKNLVHTINGMLSSSDSRLFVLDKLVPTVLLIPDHHQCGFIMNLIGKLSFEDKNKLLLILFSTEISWPLETFPVLQNLLDKGTHPELWTPSIYTPVCRGFFNQVQQNTSLNTCPQFSNLLMHFIRQHGSALTDDASWDLLTHVAEQHNTFLRTPLLNLIMSCKPTVV